MRVRLSGEKRNMASSRHWTEHNIPDLSGQRVLVTGANSGIGFETARVLAQRNAHVILACRTEAKAVEAMARIRALYPRAQLQFLPLDLASQTSVREMVAMFREQYDTLDLLINNAGVMWLPQSKTVDGFESQLGTNHLGHFALTGLLLPVLMNTPGARIVTVSSIAHRGGQIHFDDLWLDRGYGRQKAYSQSKLANLVFALELQRRLHAAGAPIISVAAHPGVANTNLAIPGFEQGGSPLLARVVSLLTPVVAQNPVNGALPTLYAATSHAVEGGDYIGPDGLYEMYGYPRKAYATRRSRNPEIGRRLWDLSEQLTGVRFDFTPAIGVRRG